MAYSGLGQTKLDSLKAVFYDQGSSPERKAEAAAGISDELLLVSLDSAAYYSSRGLDISLQSGYYPGVFKNSCVLGKVAIRKDSISKAIDIFKDARVHLDRLDAKSEALCLLLLQGYVYDIRKEFFHSHDAYYTGLRIAEEARDSAYLWSFCNNLGAHYMELGDYQKSLEMLRRGLVVYHQLDDKQKRFSLASTYNNLAVTFLELDQPDSASVYLKKALELKDVQGNYYGIYNLQGNLGKVFLMKEDPGRALVHFELAGAALDSLEGGFKGSMAPLWATQNNHLGKAYFMKGELQVAKSYFDNALLYSQQASDLSVQTDALQYLAEIFEAWRDYQTSLDYQKRYILSKDSLDARKKDKQITQLTLSYQYEKDLEARQQEFELQDLRHRRREWIYLFIIVTSAGLLVSLLLLFFLQRNKARRKRLEERTIRLEKEKISEQLEYKNKELTTNVLYLLKKNEFIGSISQKLSDVLNRLSAEDARILKGIIAELDKTTEEDTWEEFELRFKEVHTDFYNRLSKQFPDLTAQELRLCAFLKLNMTNKEIASVTYQSPDSLKTARYRLRKKLGIDREENLVAFLTRI